MNHSDTSLPLLKHVAYHHRTQGKAVEGVHIRSVTDALRGLNVHVDVLSMRGADPYASDQTMSPTAQKKGLMRLIAALPEPLFELAEIAYNVNAAMRISRYLKENPSTEMIYERYSLFLAAGVWMARRKGIPIVLEINDSACLDRMRPVFFSRIARWIENWVFRKADGMVFVSTLFKDLMVQSHGRIAPSIVSQNAANVGTFQRSEALRAQVREKYGLQDSVVCGYLGSFNAWHRIDQFIYQIVDRLDGRPDLKFLLVGAGAKFEELCAFVESRGLHKQVILPGHVRHDEVPALLSAMDMAIMPNAGEYTSPVKMFEFMACSVPPLAPDLPPIKEVLVHGDTGWLFEAGNMEQTIEHLFELTSDPEQMHEVGARAHDYVARERQWADNARQLMEFYTNIQAARAGTTPPAFVAPASAE